MEIRKECGKNVMKEGRLPEDFFLFFFFSLHNSTFPNKLKTIFLNSFQVKMSADPSSAAPSAKVFVGGLAWAVRLTPLSLFPPDSRLTLRHRPRMTLSDRPLRLTVPFSRPKSLSIATQVSPLVSSFSRPNDLTLSTPKRTIQRVWVRHL